jgi:peptide deformylase
MAIRDILEFPDPRLRAEAKPVSVFDPALTKLTEDMLETMYAAKGIGLAATQLGITQRVFVMDVSDNASQPQVIINPCISDKRGEQVYQEGCLSFPGLFADVKRAEQVHVEYEDIEGHTVTRDVEELEAVCMQHETDHLDGKVFIDYLSPLKRAMLLKRLEKQRRKAS